MRLICSYVSIDVHQSTIAKVAALLQPSLQQPQFILIPFTSIPSLFLENKNVA